MEFIEKPCTSIRFQKHFAFTLAEILIVVGIIGIVAQMTIPALITSTKNQEMVVRLKKTYTVLEQARGLVAAEQGGDMSSLFSPEAGSMGGWNEFAKHLNLYKNCGKEMGCLHTKQISLINNSESQAEFLNFDAQNDQQGGKGILADGAMISFNSWAYNCEDSYLEGPVGYRHYCGFIYVDLNGEKGPNTVGRDYFMFDITRDAIYPAGTNFPNDINTDCDPKGSAPQNGHYCTAKVIMENAMNY